MHGLIQCSCGCGFDLQNSFKNVLLRLEDLMRQSFFNPKFVLTINSGARCEEYNKQLKASPNSAHTIGLAVDIADFDDSKIRKFLWENAMRLHIRRFGDGINKGFLHIDIATGKVKYPTERLTDYPQDVVWKY